MVDHSTNSSQRPSSQQQQPHHSRFHTQYRYPYHQDFHGPLSASVVEGGHRAFAGFHSTPLHHPLNSSSSSTPFSTSAVPPPSSSHSESSSRPSLSVADILERYQDATKDFLVSVLNAKAKEDERKAEEERYKTEQIKLQAKQLELDLVLERRRASPPAARPYHASELGSGHYPSSSSYYGGNGTSTYNNHTSGSSKHTHHDVVGSYLPQDPQDRSSSSASQPTTQYSHQDPHAMQPSPQSRPPFLKINTSVRQYHAPSQPPPSQTQAPAPASASASSQRLPPSPHSTLPPLPTGNLPPKASSSGRHYGLQSFSSSAHSSPIAVVDYQSHIPPPLTPKEDHVSPTSALSPVSHLKRKSVNHDAVMDAVRAKVFRNAAGQNQQHQQKKAAATAAAAAVAAAANAELERDQTTSTRRKTTAQAEKSSPETQKSAVVATSASSESRIAEERYPEVKLEGALAPTLPLTTTSLPGSPSSGPTGDVENGANGGHRSRSPSSPPPPPAISSSTSARLRRQTSRTRPSQSSSYVAGIKEDSS